MGNRLFSSTALVALALCLTFNQATADFSPFTDPEIKNSAHTTTPTSVVVDGRMGATSYSHEFQAPPGTGGLQPNLTLVYSSLVKHSKYGYGWALPFFSSIERCTTDGPPSYDDLQDSFRVDGAKSAIFVEAKPGDVVTDAPNLPTWYK